MLKFTAMLQTKLFFSFLMKTNMLIAYRLWEHGKSTPRYGNLI